MKVVIAEKPSVAKDIAMALGNAKMHNGYWEAGGYVITNAIGHLVEIDDSIAPEKWSMDTLPIIPQRFKYRPNPKTYSQFKVVKGLVQKATEVVLASVPYETPVLVFQGEQPKFSSVGAISEEILSSSRGLLVTNEASGRHEKLIFESNENNEFYVPAFNRAGEVQLRRIRGVVKHKTKGHQIYKVTTSYGREIEASECHCFYGVVDGKIKKLKTEDLTVGQQILIPKKIDLPAKPLQIDLLSEFRKVPELAKRVLVSGRCVEEYLVSRAIKRSAKCLNGEPIAVLPPESRERLKTARLQKGMTHSSLAKILGVSQPSICWYEKKGTIREITLKKILDILDIDPKSLSFSVKNGSIFSLVGEYSRISSRRKSRKAVTKDRILLSQIDDEMFEFLSKRNDYFLSSRNKDWLPNKGGCFARFLDIDADLAYLIGLFIADGSVSSRHWVRLYYGKDKKSRGVEAKLQSICSRLGLKYAIYDKAPATEFRIHTAMLGFIFKYILRLTPPKIIKKSSGKSIPDCFFTATDNVLQSLLKGLFDGDGHYGKSWRLASTSKEIFHKLPYLFLKTGKIFSMRPIEQEENKQTLYSGYLAKEGLRKAESFSDHLCLVEIKGIEKTEYKGEWIYDFSVETDNDEGGNFVCGIGGVCQKNTDAGREGELIARLILNESGYKGPIKRLWTSEALTKEVVRREMSNLKDGKLYESLYHSANARSHGDWLVGVNFTRAASLKAGSPGNVLSIGRVQTPVLRLVVDRDNEIDNFKPEEYYVIKAVFDKNGKTYEGLLVPPKQMAEPSAPQNDDDGEKKEKEEGFRMQKGQSEQIMAALRAEKSGVVQRVDVQAKKDFPPLLHSLTSLQREANALYGFTAKMTLDIAQKLYETWKVTSYPRTEAQHLGDDGRGLAKSVMMKLGRNDLVGRVDAAGKRTFDSSKLTDHHAIIPLDKAPDGLSDAEQKIYHLVYRKFVGSFYDPYEYEVTNVLTNVNKFVFKTQGKVDKKLGWQELYKGEKAQEKNQEASLPVLVQGETVKKVSEHAQQKFTQPPARYTEATLLAAMKKLNLGTPATRAACFEVLKARAYIINEKKSVVSTPKGKEIIKHMRSNPIASPEMTAKWEEELEDIFVKNKGYSGYVAFMEGIKKFVADGVAEISAMDIAQMARGASPKAIMFAKSLAQRLKQRVPAEALSDAEKLKAYIDSAMKQLGMQPRDPNAPKEPARLSDKQLAVLEKNGHQQMADDYRAGKVDFAQAKKQLDEIFKGFNKGGNGGGGFKHKSAFGGQKKWGSGYAKSPGR